MQFYELAIQYLKSCQIVVSTDFIRERMQTHPNYPSVVAFTDTLDQLGLTYSAVVVEQAQTGELEYPLIAHLNSGDLKFMVVKSADSFIKNKFLVENWSGICICVKKKQQIRHEEHNKQKKTAEITSVASVIVASLIGVFFITALINVSGWYLIPPTILSCLGIGISLLALRHQSGQTDGLIASFCKQDSNADCTKVMKHDYLKKHWGISIAELSLGYFIFISAVINIGYALLHVGPIRILLDACLYFATFVSLLSIGYQALMLKSWCRLCLAICLVNISSFLYYLIADSPFVYQNISFTSILITLACMIGAAAMVVLIKTVVEATQQRKNALIKPLRLKRDAGLFFMSARLHAAIDTERWDEDIILGNPQAKLQLMVVCSPFCKPCARAHKKIHALLKIYGSKIGVTLRFAVDDRDPEDPNYQSVQHILQATLLTSKNAGEGAEHILESWFEHPRLELLKKNYPLENIEWTTHALKKNTQWVKQHRIATTPSLFINGYRFPVKYELSDLEMLVPELEEEIARTAAVYNVGSVV